MRRALELAARGLGETSPNPVVGCASSRGGRVVGEAGTSGPAARTPRSPPSTGSRAHGATLYVTLERARLRPDPAPAAVGEGRG